ncbi:MAG TPA: hypothetical protein VFD85_00770 [Gemmatimonadales bacterium]|nr:hypothetical protein [Gemmatimonadales bacterium]
MRRAWSAVFAVLVVGGAVNAAGQEPARGFVFSAGGGLALADRSPQGEGAFIRVASRRLPVVLDLSIQSTPGQPPVAYVFPACPMPGCSPTAGPYTGPETALMLSPSLQVTEHHGPTGAVLYRIGPALGWLPDRAPGDAAIEGGIRGGISIRLGVGSGGLLVSGDYVRLFRSGDTAPRWFLPITLGWQF